MNDNDHLYNHDPLADSAGVPWEGRSFEPNSFAGDDGSADPALIAAIESLRSGSGNVAAVVDAFRSARLLVPLLAKLGESEVGVHGQVVDKSADLSIVTVETPDQQNGLPVFSSVESMKTWNTDARPVPVDAVKAAL
ncbi:MAG: SseB family protein, partial [Microbacteriaceae bacterium]|nr:SseB family protein [Microbacteriaceae bacterium]